MADESSEINSCTDSVPQDVITKEMDLLRREVELLRRENSIWHKEQTVTKPGFNIHDLRNSLPAFGENPNYPIEKWIEELEENCILFGWSKIQMLVCAKSLLKGTAKIWLEAQPTIKSWETFKDHIAKEFGKKINSATIHQQLAKRKKTMSESYQEYMLKMMGMARLGNVEEEAVVQYIIDGISDMEYNKAILYSAETIEQLKANLEKYELMKSKMRNVEGKGQRNKEKDPVSNIKATHCFNCGASSHKMKDCRFKVRGTKCFACNEFGHIATSCPKKSDNTKKSMQISKTRSLDKMFKRITIAGVDSEALIHTVSSVNLIRSDEYFRIGAPKVNSNKTKLTGLGGAEVLTLGSIEVEMHIDNNRYTTIVHIVPEQAMEMKCLLGNELLNQAQVTITANELNLNKINTKVDQKVEKQEVTIMEDEDKYEVAQIMMIGEKVNDALENVDLLHITNQVTKNKILEIVRDYDPVPKKETKIKTKILMKSEVPIYQRPRRLSQREKEEVDKQIEEWLQEKIIQPSCSEFTSPIVLVKKKNGDTRICVDFRRINEQIVKDRYPLPLIEDQLDCLRNAKVFTTLDLKNGFFHVPMDDESRKYTSFITPTAQYEFLKTPFGLCLSPAVFDAFLKSFNISIRKLQRLVFSQRFNFSTNICHNTSHNSI